MLERAKEIIKTEVEFLEKIPLDEEVLSKIIEVLSLCKGKVILTGVGKAGLIARKIAASFSSTGTPSFFMSASDSQHGDLGAISDEDVVIAISNSGKTNEVLLTLALCRKTFSCPIIGITSEKNSEISKYCDFVLEIGKVKEVCPFGLAPTTSTTVMTLLGDILIVLTMEKKNITLLDYSRRHHGGYLGILAKDKLLEVK